MLYVCDYFSHQSKMDEKLMPVGGKNLYTGFILTGCEGAIPGDRLVNFTGLIEVSPAII